MKRNTSYIVGLLCIAELLLIAGYRNYFGALVSPALLFLVSSSIGVIPLLSSPNTKPFNSQNVTRYWQWVVYFVLITFGIYQTNHLIQKILIVYPIDPKISDIIPLIQKMVYRAEHLWYPYKNIPDFGYDLFPTYLPAQWMPFIIAHYFQIDFRFFATLVLFSALLFLFYHIVRSSKLSFFIKLALIAFPFISIYSLIDVDRIIIGVSVEQMILGYYVFLGTALLTQKNIIFRSIAVLICLMSRFSLLFWVPLFLWSVFVLEGRKKSVSALLILVGGVLLMYVLPFMLKDVSIFFKAQNAYTAAALAEWQRNPSPHLHNGLGLSVFFLDFLSGDLLHKLRSLQITMLGFSFVVMILLGWWLYKNKEKLDSRIYNVASLKVLLTIFYAFVQVPYSYLFFVPMGVSFIVLFAVFEAKFR